MAKSIIGIFTYLRYHILVGNMMKQIYILICLKHKINTWNETVAFWMYSLMPWRDGDDPRIFGGFEIFDNRIFWVGKFGKYVFGWLDLRRVFFFAYSKQSEVTVILRNVIDETKYVYECLECCKNPEGSEIRHAIFFVGIIFVQGFFVWFCWKP